jgi:hypothetical protein
MLIDGGKIIDISSKKITWHVNNNPLASGAGMINTSFIVDQALAQDYIVNATIQDYKLKNIEESVRIQTATPIVSISKIVTESGHTFVANPFFFNTLNLSELMINWVVDNKTQKQEGGQPEILSMNKLPAGQHKISVTVRSRSNQQSEQAMQENLFITQ